MRYMPLFDFSIRHAYHADNRCSDFTLEPSSATDRLSHNHRLLLRGRPDGVGVVAPVDDRGAPFIPLDADARFEWYVRVGNPDLALITEPSELNAHRIARYRNTSPASRLVPDEHPAPDLLSSDVFATVEITPGALGALPADPLRYTVEFDAATAWWSYYLVTDLPASSGTFSLVDTSASALAFGVRDLVVEPDPSDGVAGALATRHQSVRRYRFRSARRVPSRSEPHHRIELRLDDRRVAGPLPIPKQSSLTVVPMTIDGTVEEQPALSFLVRYPDRPPANNGV